jgi:hypothetical protein
VPGPDFWLNPSGVANQAQAFADWGRLAGDAARWVRDRPLTDVAQYPVYSRGANAAIAIRVSLIDWFEHLENVLQGVDAELRSVAQEGESIDLELQADLDALDPQTYLGFDTLPGGSGELLDPEDRVDEDFWVWPVNGGGIPFYCDLGDYSHLNIVSGSLVPDDLLSPTQWIETVLGWLGAKSVAQEVLDAFGGRWADLYEFADTLGGLSQFVAEMHEFLSLQVGYLDVLWQGVAANSAQLYFERLLSALDQAAGLLSDAAAIFRRYTEGVDHAATLIAGQLHSFCDAVIFAAVATALGTATIETAVGGVIGYSAAGLALLHCYVQLYKVRETLQNLGTLADIVVTLVDINAPLALFTVSVPVPTMEDAP